MAKVYLLCGKIASGKTVYAQEIQHSQNAVLLSVDDLMLKLFGSCLGEKHNETVANVFEYFYGLASKLLSKNIDVIFDSGFWTKEERTRVKKHFAELGVKTELHYITMPEAQRLKMLDDRNEWLRNSPKREYIIDRELLAKLDVKFEEPDSGEVDVLVRKCYAGQNTIEFHETAETSRS